MNISMPVSYTHLDVYKRQISLMDGTLGETLTAGSFAGDGATLYLDADGSVSYTHLIIPLFSVFTNPLVQKTIAHTILTGDSHH